MHTICVLFDQIGSDPHRATFYNTDTCNSYIHRRIVSVIPGSGRLAWLLNVAITAVLCRLQYRRNAVDIVISGDARIGCLVGLVNRFTRAKVKHIIWNFNTQRVYTGIARIFAQVSLKQTDRFIVYSKHEQAVYSSMLGLPVCKFLFKHLSTVYLDDSRYVNLPTTKQDIVVSGGSSGRNYQHLALVAQQMPDVQFLVLTYPWALGNVIMPKNVRVVTGVSELDFCRHIAQAKVFLLPLANNDTANGHIAIAQAMIFKSLLITNPTNGTRDYLEPNFNCITYPSNDLLATTQAIRLALTDTAVRDNIVSNAYLYATQNYPVRREVETLYKILDAIH